MQLEKTLYQQVSLANKVKKLLLFAITFLLIIMPNMEAKIAFLLLGQVPYI